MEFTLPSEIASIPSPSPWENFSREDGPLVTIVEEMIKSDLSEYFLAIIYDSVFKGTDVFKSLSHASNPKQLIELSEQNILKNVLWNLNIYMAVIFLIIKPDFVVNFCNAKDKDLKWNYKAKILIIAPNMKVVEEVSTCKKALKTKLIIGLVPKLDNARKWAMYENDVLNPQKLKLLVLRHSPASNYFISNMPRDYKQRELIVAAFEYAPSVVYKKNSKDEIIDRYGIEVLLVEAFAKHLNFKIKYVVSNQEELWGDFLGNDNYSGLLGLIYNGHGDVGIGNNFITDVGSLFVDNVFPIMFSTTCFMNTARPPVPKWMSIFHPFQLISWITIFAVLICTGIILQLYVFGSSKLAPNNIKSGLPSIFVTYALLLQQSAEVRVEKGKSIQVYLMFLGLYTLIITNAYSSNLTSFLTVEKKAKEINTIKELQDSGLNVLLLNKFLGNSLTFAADQNLKDLGKKIVLVPEGWKKILPLVADGEGAFLQAEYYLKYVATIFEKESDRVTRFRIIKECFNSFYVTLAVEHNSIYKDQMDDIVMRLVEGGIAALAIAETFDRIRKENNISADSQTIVNDDTETAPSTVTLSIEHLQGAFLIYSFGIGLAMISFLIELLSYGQFRRRQKELNITDEKIEVLVSS